MQMFPDAMWATTRREPITFVLIPAVTEAQSCLLLHSTKSEKFEQNWGIADSALPGFLILYVSLMSYWDLKKKNNDVWKQITDIVASFV